MGFEICNFSDLKEGNAIFEKMRKSIDLKRLVPVLGSGFSFNFHTNGGRVPSVDDLKSEMVRLLKECEEYECTSEEELRAAELSELADALLPILEKCADSMEVDKEKTTVLSHFLKYMEDNFYQVRSVPNHIKEFLKCEWPYLYTLNYDDAIEKTIGVENCEIVITYSDLNRTWLDTRTCVIKLHGDVHRLLQTKDLHFCILNKKQYLESITSKENKALMEWLKTDYTSKDLLFIGCGLNNEIDFLFAEGVAKASKLSDTASENSFYIYYDKNPDKGIGFSEHTRLANHGISNIIRVKPEEMEAFYKLIHSLYQNSKKIERTDKLERYRDTVFTTMASYELSSNLPYIFENTSLWKKDGSRTVCFPQFFTPRTISSEIVLGVENGVSITIMAGNRFSGKTYALLEIVDLLQKRRKTVYYINDTAITDGMLERMVSYKDVVFVFDSGSISNLQLQTKFLEKVGRLKENSIQVICAVNRSDRNFAKKVQGEYLQKTGIEVYCISPKLDDVELKDINEKLGKLTMTSRRRSETFLDYAIRLEKAMFNDYSKILPDTHVINDLDMLRCVLLLSNNGYIDSAMAARFNVMDELSLLCNMAEIAVQKDYLSELEISSSNHSGIKYVSNSLYWLYRCLSDYAKESNNYANIAAEIVNIVELYIAWYNSMETRKPYEVYEAIKPYYYLDTLQTMFFFDSPSKGSIVLPHIIYSKLRTVLNGEYQFLHQTAKCELRYSQQLGLKTPVGRKLLEEANIIIDRALELAEKSQNANRQYTLTHMNVTKALILTNYLRYVKDSTDRSVMHLRTAINSYYYFYVEYNEYSADLTGSELTDTRWFMEQFAIEPHEFRKLIVEKEYQQKVQDVLSAYYKKPITVMWK